MRLKSLIAALTDVLEQERILLGSLEGSVYTAPGTGAFSSSIGAHIRHNSQHGVALPERFGVAPSTQRYERRHSGEWG